MGKVKIFERMNREAKKSKLQRNRLRFKLIALLTSTALVSVNFVGCNDDNYDYSDSNYDVYAFTTSYPTLDGEEVIIQSNEFYSDVDKKSDFSDADISLLNTNVKFDNGNKLAVENTISGVDSNYTYSYLYNIDEAYEMYLSKKNDYKGIIDTKMINNNEVNYDYLVYKVKENNSTYSSTSLSKMYSDLDDRNIELICEIIVKTINEELAANNVEYNIANICEVLNNLKIFAGSGFTSAYVTDDDEFIVNYNNIGLSQSLSGEQSQFQITISHETYHLLQKASVEKLKNEGVDRKHGFCKKYDSLETNPFYWTWEIEGAAENLAAKKWNASPTTYLNKISYINSLKLSQILNNDFKLYDIEYLTCQESLDNVFNKFGLEDVASKKEFIEMMYSLEIMHSSPEDFIQLYESQVMSGEKITDTQKDALNYELKGSICTTITKYFYSNLSNELLDNKITLEQIFQLISLYEEDMNSHLDYDSESQLQYNKNFISNYVLIQDSFFEQISNSIGLDKTYILDAYINYNQAISYAVDVNLNYAVSRIDLDILSAEKNNFLSLMKKKEINSKTLSIYEISNSEFMYSKTK